MCSYIYTLIFFFDNIIFFLNRLSGEGNSVKLDAKRKRPP
jgi:hypothetical protein